MATGEGESVGALTDALEESLNRMSWTKDADKAAIALARAYAKQIDDVLEGEFEQKCPDCGTAVGLDGAQVTKALYLGPHLLNALRALGATPEGRAGLDVSEQVKGALSGIRNRRAAGGAKQ
ncbi:terminase small subunit [Gordonia phage Huffy]|uniref:Terminase small subunit n=3 Tax=Vendettavirus TaxID=2049885 RepID=A0A160DFF5_9CAUD|nr:hypothetical protein BH795_gp06 [Gordonia phage Vendetta]YP_009275361.1 hypothetical protein BH760_gp06 [Gordonia phage Splinter]YP_010051097.1 terminase small subunit [Gordonia phage TZGordon]AQY55610.1 terminase small subunit [Gordonia phage Huffy]AQY55692.1 terminase small subunit [Gordonia phage DinoDaryn]WNO25751.1 terminase small subunit [Gordonia phage Goib]ANA85554.1 terminase small subunit [Gordonia phage Vendetta]ANA85633.1 terminase small subunit [Gordonia phage Splinter]